MQTESNLLVTVDFQGIDTLISIERLSDQPLAVGQKFRNPKTLSIWTIEEIRSVRPADLFCGIREIFASCDLFGPIRQAKIVQIPIKINGINTWRGEQVWEIIPAPRISFLEPDFKRFIAWFEPL
jgi:hypothetical protein